MLRRKTVWPAYLLPPLSLSREVNSKLRWENIVPITNYLGSPQLQGIGNKTNTKTKQHQQ